MPMTSDGNIAFGPKDQPDNSSIVIGDVWIHKKGGHYKVVCKAQMEDTGQNVVVYQGMATGHIWVRSEYMFRMRFNKQEQINEQPATSSTPATE